MIDAHADVFMKIACAVVPPRVPSGFWVMQSVRIDESCARKPPVSLPFSLGNVQLVGMTLKELQDSVGVRREADADGVYRGNVYIFPQDIRTNTWKANSIGFNTSGSAIGPVFTQGAPTGRFIAPAGSRVDDDSATGKGWV